MMKYARKATRLAIELIEKTGPNRTQPSNSLRIGKRKNPKTGFYCETLSRQEGFNQYPILLKELSMRADVITSKLVLASYRLLICASLLVLLGMVSVSPVLAQLDPKERPATQDLLPETTVSFFQVDNFRDLVEKLQDTTIAQMFEEESIAGLRDGLIEEAKQAYQDNKDEFTPEFEDLSSLPAGEMTFAVIAPRRKNLEYMLILELNEEDEALDRVLDSGREFLENEAPDSVTKEDANQDGVEYETFLFEGRPFRFFRLGGLMVGSTSESELDAFLDRWAGRENEKVRPLSSNRKFITIMNRCLGNSELRPEARFFVDPIQFAKSYTRGNVSAQFVLNFLPALGLDGLLGVGGSLLLAEEDFEVVMHTHLLLSDPRTGIFEMIALKPTDYRFCFVHDHKLEHRSDDERAGGNRRGF